MYNIRGEYNMTTCHPRLRTSHRPMRIFTAWLFPSNLANSNLSSYLFKNKPSYAIRDHPKHTFDCTSNRILLRTVQHARKVTTTGNRRKQKPLRCWSKSSLPLSLSFSPSSPVLTYTISTLHKLIHYHQYEACHCIHSSYRCCRIRSVCQDCLHHIDLEGRRG